MSTARVIVRLDYDFILFEHFSSDVLKEPSEGMSLMLSFEIELHRQIPTGVALHLNKQMNRTKLTK